MSTRIVFVGGGSGGHFYPLMAIADSIRRGGGGHEAELYYMGPEPYDEVSLSERNIIFTYTPAGKRRKYRSVLNVFDSFKVFFGIFVSLWKLFMLYPDTVVSKGGYTSVPVVVAAWLLRIPIVIHESDAVPGSANKLGARFARYIGIAYPETASQFPNEKTALVGIPVRQSLFEQVRMEDLSSLGVDGERPLILILGGSQGAERVNTLIIESLDELLPSYAIVHQTGPALHGAVVATVAALGLSSELLSHYHPVPFLAARKLHTAMTAAAVIISRAGSGTIYEISLHGKPSILIPIPEEISHDQRSNAYSYARSGAATVMEERNLTDGLLLAEITRMMGDPVVYQQMSESALAFAARDASEKMTEIINVIAAEHQ